METFSWLLTIFAGNSPVTVEMFSLICAWINGWINNIKVGDSRGHRAHYDVTVMPVYTRKCVYIMNMSRNIGTRFCFTLLYFSRIVKFTYFPKSARLTLGLSCDCHNACEGTLTHDDVIKWNHFPRYWPFVRGIYRSPVNSPHKGQWRGALMFSLICAWIND